MTTDLAPLELARRVQRLRERLAPAGCDALVVTDRCNIRYLTGFTGTAGLLLVTRGSAVLVTDGRYGLQAEEEIAASGAPVSVEVVAGEPASALAGLASDSAKVGLEAASVTWSQQRAMADTWLAGSTVVPTTDLVEELRATKDAGEVALIEAAAAIADAALAEVRPRLAKGPTEAAFALDLEVEMRRRGAEGRAFATIVASGPNGSRPHARPTDRVVEAGDLVVVDFGAVLGGYRSDITRTMVVGDASPAQAELLEVVAAAQAAGVAAVGPGVPCREVDAACRSVIGAAGLGDRFVHGTGHGVGLQIHEAPWVNSRSAATLAVGHVVTVEPGVYVPAVGGVRVEDTVVVTEDGARPLTRSPKEPRVC